MIEFFNKLYQLYLKCIDVLCEQALRKNINSFIIVDKIGFSQIKEINMYLKLKFNRPKMIKSIFIRTLKP